jgi:hypothetical protein
MFLAFSQIEWVEYPVSKTEYSIDEGKAMGSSKVLKFWS